MAAPVTRGILVSLENTPQATDDEFGAASTGLTEDSGVIWLNVMANDLGGAAKTLYSLDNSISDGGDRPVDLLTQDLARTEASSNDTSLGGAKIWIGSDGRVGYDPGSAFQYLGAGQTATDQFTYAIRLGNGTISWATATVQVTGVNDAAVLSDTTDPTAVLELANAAAQDLAAIAGSFSVNDPDIGDTLTPSVVGSPAVKLDGSAFTLPAGAAALVAGGALSLTGATSNGGAVSIGYTYDPGAVNLDFLRAGQSLTITYTVKVNDGTGDSGTQDVTFTITGTNDAAVLSDATDPAAVLELANASAQDLAAITGSFSVTDLDVGDTLTPSVVGSPVVKLDGSAFTLPAGAGALVAAGALSLTGVTSNGGAANIGYTYDPGAADLDFLGAGQSLTITYTVKVNDGTGDSGTQDVTFTITGSNDVPVVAAVDVTGGVTELVTPTGNLSDTGTINFTDVDLTDVHSVGAVTPSAGALGTLSASVSTDTTGSGTGGVVSWNYSVAASAAEYLAKDQTKVETFSFDLSDGQGGSVTRTVSVTITGTNDVPDIQVVTTDSAAATLSETNAGLSTAGTLTVTDVDTADTVASSVTSVTLAGNTGSLTEAAVSAFLSVSPAAGLAANSGDTHNLAWTFNSGLQAFDYLAVGEHLTLTYTVQSGDGNGGTDTQQVSITINGTADGPTIASLPSAFVGADPNDNDTAGPGALATAEVGTGSSEELQGTNAADTINGGNGIDVIYGYGGNDTITGDNQSDSIYGGADNDTIDGNNSGDTLYGGSGGDTIHGNNGDDTIYGGSGSDNIFGDDGADTIIGGYGADTMNGGALADTFKFLDLKDTNDTIANFVSGTDKLDLSAIASGDADGAFNWGGSQADAIVQAHSVTWYTSGSNVVVLADTDGDVATAEFMITLTGIASIASTDFVL